MAETQIAYHSNTGVTIQSGPPNSKELKSHADVKQFKYSPLGTYLCLVYQKHIEIIYSKDSSIFQKIDVENVVEFEFSPKENYLSTWTRYVKPTDNDRPNRNLCIWSLQGKEISSFVQKDQENWNVKWADDEELFARISGQELVFYQSSNFQISNRVNVSDVASFSLSPGKRRVLAAFTKEKNGSPACVKIIDMLNLQVLSQKSFFRADSVVFHWNSIGTHVLVFTHTDVDATGKSYYGETNLYYLSITGNFDCKVNLDKPGPIHDVCWSPNSKEFIVVYGTMPAKITMFDHRAAPMYELGNAARNQVRYNPTGRLFFVAGFGNLAGDLDVWDRKTFKKIITIQASNSSSCEWSPDGRHFMTSILYKRMKVDNGIKIYHFTGVLVAQVDVKEMYNALWRPDNHELWPERAQLSPPPAGIKPATPAKSSGKYVPPGLRNSVRSTERVTLSSIDVKAKNGKPKENVVGRVAGGQLELEKKRKNILKKLKQIAELKEKRQQGLPLELTQIQKIESEEALKKELEGLDVI